MFLCSTERGGTGGSGARQRWTALRTELWFLATQDAGGGGKTVRKSGAGTMVTTKAYTSCLNNANRHLIVRASTVELLSALRGEI